VHGDADRVIRAVPPDAVWTARHRADHAPGVNCSGLLSWANDWHVARCEFGTACPLSTLEHDDREAYVAGHAPLPSRLSEWCGTTDAHAIQTADQR
jgi:hypothetical protein